MTSPINSQPSIISPITSNFFDIHITDFLTQDNLIKLWNQKDCQGLKPEEIPQELIAFVHQMDAIHDDRKGDFVNFIQRTTSNKAPILLRPNIKRKPYFTVAGQSCQVARELRLVIENNYQGEIMTLVYGHKKAKEAGLVIVHIPHSLKVDNKALRAVAKNNKGDIISFSHNHLDAQGKPETMKLNNIQYLANGLFNPYSINADNSRQALHVFDCSLMDMENGICSTNASSRSIGQFFNPRQMTEHAMKIYQLPKYHAAIIADIAQYNLSEI